jgi:hypothetical protein
MNNTSQPYSYWTEEYLYFVYKLANIKRFAGKELIDFEYLKPPDKQSSSAWFNFAKLISELNISIDGLAFHKDLYKKHSPDDYAKVERQIEMMKDTEQGLILAKVFNGQFDFQDLLKLPITQASMFEWFEFSADLSETTAIELQK